MTFKLIYFHKIIYKIISLYFRDKNLMKFYSISSKTPLFFAVENKDVQMVKILLSCKTIDVNASNILNFVQ